MTRMIIENGIVRRRILLLAALLAVVAALGPVAMNTLAVHSDEPTVTVERLGVLTSFPDDVEGTIKLRLKNGPRRVSQPFEENMSVQSSRGTQVIQIEDFDNVMMAKITFEDQAIIPWHTHPGAAIATVAEGSLTVTNANDCVPREYKAGNGFVDPGHGNVHMARAKGTTVVYVTFFEVPDDGVATIPVDFQGCSRR